MLVTSLLLFSIVPAATVGWVLYRSNLQSVQTLAEKTVDGVAQRVQISTQEHLAQAHVVLNGLVQEQPGEAGVARARQLIQNPTLFEQTAFAMTRMSPRVPQMVLATHRGEYLGVEALSQSGNGATQVAVRKEGGQGRSYFSAEHPGDRRQKASADSANYEPRTRPWYQAAMENKGRSFTAVSPSAAHNQLLITLAQPVYGVDGGSLGVFAVDLHLAQLKELLQTMVFSAHGTAFLLDERGLLVANSTIDPLFTSAGGKLERSKPLDSRNPVIRSAYNEVASSLGQTLPDSVQRIAFLHRVPMGDDTLIVVLKPFGESLGLRWSLVVAAPESDFAAASQAALRNTLGVMVLALVLGALLATWLAYRLSRRFRALSVAAGQLARAEVPQVQQNARITEVRQLSQAMHDSAEEILRNRAAIDAQNIALQDANETLEARVASRTAELAASREEALAAARRQGRLPGHHEPRDPHPAQRRGGHDHPAGRHAAGPRAARLPAHHARLQRPAAGRDQRHPGFSKIESGKLDLENEPLNLLATIEEACDIGARARAREGPGAAGRHGRRAAHLGARRRHAPAPGAAGTSSTTPSSSPSTARSSSRPTCWKTPRPSAAG